MTRLHKSKELKKINPTSEVQNNGNGALQNTPIQRLPFRNLSTRGKCKTHYGYFMLANKVSSKSHCNKIPFLNEIYRN